MTSFPTISCSSCAHTIDTLAADTTCPRCDGLLNATIASPPARGVALQQLFDSRLSVHSYRSTAAAQSGVWRFRELVLDLPIGEAVSLHEGNTPLIESAAIARFASAESLRIKHEGHNPSGSFKDRGMTVAMTQARRCRATAVACASTGNTSSSMAAYAAQAGIPALVLVPAGRISTGKLAQTVAYAARTLMVRGDFDDCLRLVREASKQLGVYLANSVNPYRIEGQKTIIFELLQQCGWNAPDWIAFPAGNLGNTSAFGKALSEAHELGLISHVPRLLAVQASGAAPFARAFSEGFVTRHRVKAETIATAIRIGDPASWDRGVAAIRSTDGVVAAVSDDEILAAKSEIDACGVGCEPASAASIAGVRSMISAGIIEPGANIVAILTGHMLKDPDSLMPKVPAPPWQRADCPIEIDATLAAVERVIRNARLAL